MDPVEPRQADRQGLEVGLRPQAYLPEGLPGAVRYALELRMAVDPSLLPAYVDQLRRPASQ